MNLSKIAQMLGKKGGLKSAEVRFKNMTAEQKSKHMKWVRKQATKSDEQAIEMLNGQVGQKASLDFLRETGQIKD